MAKRKIEGTFDKISNKIENEIFKKVSINFETLEEYGFTKKDSVYIYSKIFLDNFRADITIDDKGIIAGKVYDLDMNDEYFNFRVESQTGEFVNRVREEYKNILRDIVKFCCIPNYFIYEQTNRIASLIVEKYKDEPYYAWEKYPDYGVFKNPNNDKWYGLVFNIDRSKFDKKQSGEVEGINVKVDSSKIPLLLKKKGFYPAYHMNKKNWVTILLDDTLTDEEIMEFVQESHKFTETTKEWIVPANPKYYDVINCFNETDSILWKQSSKMNIGDIVYLYVAVPYSAILYKCEVIEIDIPYEYQDDNLSMKKVMKIKLLDKYEKDKYTFAKLNEYGIKSIRGPIHMPESLSKEMN